MYEELKPGPTGGNDYSDAWQVFGERLTAAAEGRLTYFTAPVTPGSAGLRVTGEQFKAAYWAGYKGPAEEMWNRMANALNASSLDAPAFLSGLGNETVAEFDARELAAAPPLAELFKNRFNAEYTPELEQELIAIIERKRTAPAAPRDMEDLFNALTPEQIKRVSQEAQGIRYSDFWWNDLAKRLAALAPAPAAGKCPSCGHRNHDGVSCLESDSCGCGQ